MGFLMDGLEAESYDRQYDDAGLLKRIIGYFRPNRAAMLLVVGMVLLSSLMDAALPLLISRGINRLATEDTFSVATGGCFSV